jgi:hypothetical protein
MLLWGVVILGTGFLVGTLVAFVAGMLIGYYHLAHSGWVVLVAAIAFICNAAAWIMYDHSSNFMQRSALAIVGHWRRKAQ